jgi:hypothetical protein
MLEVRGELVGQDLDRHLAVERRVLGPPNDTHAALADLLDEAVVEQLLCGLVRHADLSMTLQLDGLN